MAFLSVAVADYRQGPYRFVLNRRRPLERRLRDLLVFCSLRSLLEFYFHNYKNMQHRCLNCYIRATGSGRQKAEQSTWLARLTTIGFNLGVSLQFGEVCANAALMATAANYWPLADWIVITVSWQKLNCFQSWLGCRLADEYMCSDGTNVLVHLICWVKICVIVQILRMSVLYNFWFCLVQYCSLLSQLSL